MATPTTGVASVASIAQSPAPIAPLAPAPQPISSSPAAAVPSESLEPVPSGAGPPEETAAALSPGQLDQMLAPVALYPDPLIAQILMAATYPLEVVEADRWLQHRDNAGLQDDLAADALDRQTWDPSVKSLIPFPQILHMMDDNLDWTEALGEAFLADQAAVLSSIQRLRHLAQAGGQLQSTPQQEVSTEDQAIEIEPVDQNSIDVPSYDPWIAYNPWPYTGSPPYDFPEYLGEGVAAATGSWRAQRVVPLWGWGRPDWGQHRIAIDRDRWTSLNHRPPPTEGKFWEHDPSHRAGVPYVNPAVRWRFDPYVGARERERRFRGYPPAAAGRFPLSASTQPQGARPWQPPRTAAPPSAPGSSAASAWPRVGIARLPSGPTLPNASPWPAAPHSNPTPPVPHSPPAFGAPGPSRQTAVPRVFPPTFESYGRGVDVRGQFERGQSSRMAMPAAPIRTPAPAPVRGFAAAGGGRGRR